jgi:hypothetical protein
MIVLIDTVISTRPILILNKITYRHGMVRNDRVQRIGGINGLMRGRIRLFSVAPFR